jgi:hypothetical protein
MPINTLRIKAQGRMRESYGRTVQSSALASFALSGRTRGFRHNRSHRHYCLNVGAAAVPSHGRCPTAKAFFNAADSGRVRLAVNFAGQTQAHAVERALRQPDSKGRFAVQDPAAVPGPAAG